MFQIVARPSSCLAFALSLLLLAGLARATAIPADSDHVRSLDGTWRFKLEQGGDQPPQPGVSGKRPIKVPEKLEPFEKLDYAEDASWHDFTVPGNWEIAGYSPANYGFPDNAIGLFRLQFDVPAEWKDRVVKINFDGVQNGAEIYCNGQPVTLDESSEGKKNFHQGGFDPFQADLTPVVKFGAKILLAIRVYKNTKAVDLDTGDYFFMGGVHRPVTLFSVPKTHVADYTVRTKLLGDDKAELRVLMSITSPLKGANVTMQLEGFPPVESVADNQNYIEIPQTLDHPKLWSAEKPNLYNLTLDLKDASGNVLEHLTQRVGVREIEIENGIFKINRVQVKFTGICRHDCWPTV